MNKILLLIVGILLGCLSLTAQQTAVFELPLYFIDSLKNKDTLIVGLDRASSNWELNEEFGEKAIEEPFDSIFEVRAIKSFLYRGQNQYYSKKIIARPEQNINETGDTCYSSQGAIIVFNAKYLPVKMYYDRDIINELCVPEGTILWQTFLTFLLGVELAFLPETDYQCVFSSDTLILDPRVMKERNEEIMDFALLDQIEIENGEQIQVQGYQMMFRHSLSIYTFSPAYPNGNIWVPCDSVDYVGLDEWTGHSFPPDTYLYPNPTSDWVYLKNSAINALYLHLYDCSGKPVMEQQLFQHGFQVNHLSSGLYFYKIIDKNKNMIGSGKLQKW